MRALRPVRVGFFAESDMPVLADDGDEVLGWVESCFAT